MFKQYITAVMVRNMDSGSTHEVGLMSRSNLVNRRV